MCISYPIPRPRTQTPPLRHRGSHYIDCMFTFTLSDFIFNYVCRNQVNSFNIKLAIDFFKESVELDIIFVNIIDV